MFKEALAQIYGLIGVPYPRTSFWAGIIIFGLLGILTFIIFWGISENLYKQKHLIKKGSGINIEGNYFNKNKKGIVTEGDVNANIKNNEFNENETAIENRTNKQTN